VPTFDQLPHAPWLDSLRRSRARRAAAARRERRSRAARIAAAVVAALSLTAASSAVATSGGVTAGVPQSRQAETVAAIQRALGITADGIAGPQTRRAIRRFQRAHDLQVDGIAGPQTLAALGLGGATASSASGVDSVLEAIARCESGGDPSAVSADGRYRGKYQFSRATWRAMGGAGDPAAAPEAEQDRRAAKLLRRAGTSPWPNCA
jgi:Transglycosylase-like domain/Putative peptidoglycan binding domain